METEVRVRKVNLESRETEGTFATYDQTLTKERFSEMKKVGGMQTVLVRDSTSNTGMRSISVNVLDWGG